MTIAALSLSSDLSPHRRLRRQNCTPACAAAAFRRSASIPACALKASCCCTWTNQIGAAAQVEAQMNIVLPVRNEFGLASRQPDDAVNADQDDGKDEEKLKT